MNKTCEFCGKEFKSLRSDARFCPNGTCRLKHNRAQVKDTPVVSNEAMVSKMEKAIGAIKKDSIHPLHNTGFPIIPLEGNMEQHTPEAWVKKDAEDFKAGWKDFHQKNKEYWEKQDKEHRHPNHQKAIDNFQSNPPHPSYATAEYPNPMNEYDPENINPPRQEFSAQQNPLPKSQGEVFHCTWPVRVESPPMPMGEVKDRLQRIKGYNAWCKRNGLMQHYQWLHHVEEKLLTWGASPRLANGITEGCKRR